ncbi:MAG: hypothetical protein Q4Q17_01095 [Tissierellia bacterium]|nr:hypothetical protein [Tissierellia bacterium]
MQKYNIGAYNRPQRTDGERVTANMSGTLQGRVLPTVYLAVEDRMSGTIALKAIMDLGQETNINSKAGLQSASVGVVALNLKDTYPTLLLGTVDGEIIGYVTSKNTGKLNSQVHGSLQYVIESKLIATLEALADLNITTPVELYMSGQLHSQVTSDLLDTIVMSINGALGAGQTMVIDAENRTVTIDGENAYHLREGDWIKLSRNLVELIVQNGSNSDIEGTIIYTERWI